MSTPRADQLTNHTTWTRHLRHHLDTNLPLDRIPPNQLATAIHRLRSIETDARATGDTDTAVAVQIPRMVAEAEQHRRQALTDRYAKETAA